MPTVHYGDKSMVISENGSVEKAIEFMRRQEQEEINIGIIRDQKYFHEFDLWSLQCRLCGKHKWFMDNETWQAERRGFCAMTEIICRRSVHSPYYYDLATSLVDGAGI